MRIDRIKLVAELTKRNMTQQDLSKLSGVCRPTISYIKNGKSCSNQVGMRIAKALDMDIEDLLEQ